LIDSFVGFELSVATTGAATLLSSSGLNRICLHLFQKRKARGIAKKVREIEEKGLERISARAGAAARTLRRPHTLRERRYGLSFGPSEVTIFAKRES
jgi:hypothetical protein